MKQEIIKWNTIIQIPDPETILTIVGHIIVHFWKAESNREYYKTHFFPRSVEDISLRIDHLMYRKCRYHLYEVSDNDHIGIWDETPYHIDFSNITEKPDSFYFDHGDYRHDFQLFLRSLLKYIKHQSKYHTSIDRLYKVLTHFPLLHWKCPVCRMYNEWSRDFTEKFLLEKNMTIAPSSLLFLLTFSNKKIGDHVAPEIMHQFEPLNNLLISALQRFFTHFEKIYEQTSTDPLTILHELITILEKYTSVYNTDQIHEFEHQCARDMKHYLYENIKFLRTKSIPIHTFPRDMMIIRDIFGMIVGIWTTSSPPIRDGSPGILMLLYNILFKDKAITKDLNATQPLVVFHSLDTSIPLTRHMTPKEINVFTDYHPLLRQSVFQP